MIERLTIHGLRGFATEHALTLAQPTGAIGSGLTILVGPNNAGKSTALEALRAFVGYNAPSFTQGKRNLAAGDGVRIVLHQVDTPPITLATVANGGSETHFDPPFERNQRPPIYVLPSRRAFDPYFSRSRAERDSFAGNYLGLQAQRPNAIQEFSQRLFRAQENKDAFNAVLRRLIDPIPEWTIDQTETGQHFLKFSSQDGHHSSEGLGEGIVSLFAIVDALYDSTPGSLIGIDEPELSLHPALQRRLAALLAAYAAERQIVVATHSPYFINLSALENGATVARAHKVDGGTVLSQLQPATGAALRGLLADQNQNNPHILGLKAQEVFSLEDPPILLEGQEDVVFFERVQRSVGVSLRGEFFGWGVGGAGNMGTAAQILHDLGFARVAGILDANETAICDRLVLRFPNYRFVTIPANDVRTKTARARSAVQGLLDDDNEQVRPEHVAPTRALFDDINGYLAS